MSADVIGLIISLVQLQKLKVRNYLFLQCRVHLFLNIKYNLSDFMLLHLHKTECSVEIHTRQWIKCGTFLLPLSKLDIEITMSHFSKKVCNGKLAHHKSCCMKVIFAKKWHTFNQVLLQSSSCHLCSDKAIKGNRVALLCFTPF